ncbi:MAG TPA: flagellar assembly peptidoglycan hydrolase FlgJ [Gammaproteobacteria bacterium]|nr:flagellar assembly peptidoglycan hydrolase FlgJ [Gammaproteobacteria bacterium]
MQTLPSSLPPPSLNQDIYTDLSSFSRMRKEAQNNPEKTLKTVARQFESLFMQMMLKSMRDASFGDPVFDTSQSRFYQDMFDKQLSLNLSQGRGIGLAEMLEKQLHGSLHKPAASTPVPPADSPAVKDQKRKLIMPVLGAAGEVSQKIGSRKRKLIMPVLSAANEVSQKTKSRSAPDESMPAYFSSPQDFVQKLMPLAQKAAGKLGVKPEVLLAQAALETGWGQHISRHTDGSSSHNLFNIKAGAGWDGDRVAIRTLEYRHGLARHERAAFRAYDNYADSFSDYVDFLQSGPRYQSALKKVDNPQTFIRELHGAGYATDPDYANKIIDIMQRPMLQAAIKDGTRHAG